MKYSISKCVTLKFYRIQNPDYFINNQKPQSIKQHPYLGVVFDQTMSFIQQVNSVTSKATRTLNFIY